MAAIASGAAVVVAAAAAVRLGLPHPPVAPPPPLVLAASPAAPPPGGTIEETAFPTALAGWVTFAGGGRTRLLATADGGRSWSTQLTWEGLGSDRLTCFDAASCVLVVQTLTGVLNGRPAAPPARATVLRTEDGGRHWAIGGPLPPGSTANTRFLDVRQGWALTTPHARDQDDAPARLVHTSDGGAAWMDVGGLPPADYSDVVFRTPRDGFVASGGRLLASRDGGRHWTVQTVPPPSGLPADGLRLQLRAPAFSGGHGMLVLDAWRDGAAEPGPAPGQPAGAGMWAYLSEDGGRTWSAPVRLPAIQSGAFPSLAALAADGTIWAASNRDLWTSGDRGAHWQAWHPALPAGHAIQRLVPAGRATAWVLTVRPPTPEGLARVESLLRSDDGGAHWTGAGPVRTS